MSEVQGNKVVLLGEAGVGKTSIINVFLGIKFSSSVVANIGIERQNKKMTMKDGKEMKIIVWDTAGQERFHSIATSTIKNSKIINENFGNVISNFKAKYNQDGVNCEIDHVDGTMHMSLRKEKLELLEEANGNDENVCRILSNAKCLSEGIDVPALDAVLFLNLYVMNGMLIKWSMC